jgi:MFS family permease
MGVSTKVAAKSAEAPLFTARFSLLLVTQSLFGLAFSTFFLLPKFVRLELHGTDAQIGRVGAVGTIAGVIAFPFVGALNDRFGRRPFVLLGALLLTGSAYAMLAVHEVGPLFYALRAVHGLAFALLFNSATTLVSDDAEAGRLSQALSVFGASLIVTQALAPAIAEAVSLAYGWPAVFTCSGSAAALSLVSASFVRDVHAPGGRSRSRQSALGTLLRRADMRRVVAVIAAAGAGFGTVFTFHQPYALSLGVTRVSGYFVAYAACAVVTRLGFALRIAPRRRLLATAVAVAAYALAVALTAWLSPVMLVVVGGVMGFAQGIFYPLYNAAAVERVTLEQRGSLMALYHGGFNLGISVALGLGGSLASAFGYPALFWTVSACVAWAAYTLGREAQNARADELSARP